MRSGVSTSTTINVAIAASGIWPAPQASPTAPASHMRGAGGDVPHLAAGGEDDARCQERDTCRDRLDQAQRIDLHLALVAEAEVAKLLTDKDEKARRHRAPA